MLIDEFGEIMAELGEETKYARFDLALPKATETEHIPQSLIAQRLRNTINDLRKGQKVTKLNEQFDIVTISICDEIVVTFKSIYYKYVDPSNAIFMINISSRLRKTSTEQLDHDYYTKLRESQASNGVQRADSDVSLASLNTSIARRDMKYSVINADLQVYLTRNPNSTEKEVLKWVLKQLIIPMERNVSEIANLMNDSFSRFKTSQQQLFFKLCEMKTLQ